MDLRLQPSELERGASADGVLKDHCRRVAAVAAEVARSLELPDHLHGVLERAALLHHSYDLGSRALARLAFAVSAAVETEVRVEETVTCELATVLALVLGEHAPSRTESLQVLAGIVRMCHMLDDQIVGLPLDPRGIDAVLEELEGFASFEGFDPALVRPLRRLRVDSARLAGGGLRLPVQAQSAQRVFRALGRDQEYEMDELAHLAERDPVLGGALIQVANSALYSPERRVSTIRQAIVFVGCEAAREVMLATALRPLFASAGLVRLWAHSVHVAQLTSALAGDTGLLDPQEGLLMGLVHDIGALAAETLPRDAVVAWYRITEKGCPPTYAEQLVLGRDHGEIGADILLEWNFPEHLIGAIRYHHQPERSESALSSVLYLAEFWSGLDEDLPSYVRLEECTRRTGISLEGLACARVRRSALSILPSVA